MTIGEFIEYLKKFDPKGDSIGFIIADRGKRVAFSPAEVHPITDEGHPFFLVEINTADPIPFDGMSKSREAKA